VAERIFFDQLVNFLPSLSESDNLEAGGQELQELQEFRSCRSQEAGGGSAREDLRRSSRSADLAVSEKYGMTGVQEFNLGVGNSFSFWRKPVGSLMFPENPLRPRSDLRAKPLAALRFCPRGQDYEGSSVDHYFRLYHTAFAPLHTLRAAIADDYAMFASGWWLAFAGWGCSPHWIPVLCFRVLFSFPLHPLPHILGFHDAT